MPRCQRGPDSLAKNSPSQGQLAKGADDMSLATTNGTAGINTAGADKDASTRALNAELQDKGFLVTSSDALINWARTGSLH